MFPVEKKQFANPKRLLLGIFKVKLINFSQLCPLAYLKYFVFFLTIYLAPTWVVPRLLNDFNFNHFNASQLQCRYKFQISVIFRVQFN